MNKEEFNIHWRFAGQGKVDCRSEGCQQSGLKSCRVLLHSRHIYKATEDILNELANKAKNV